MSRKVSLPDTEATPLATKFVDGSTDESIPTGSLPTSPQGMSGDQEQGSGFDWETLPGLIFGIFMIVLSALGLFVLLAPMLRTAGSSG